MNIPYCICNIKSKDKIIVGHLIFMFLFHILISIIAIIEILAGYNRADLFIVGLAILMWILWVSDWYEFKRQAIFLKHTKKCAKRYAFIAAFATNVGYYPSYGNMQGYKSLNYRKAIRRLFSKR